MEIKRPVSNIPPELREINLGQKEEEASSSKPSGVSSIADSVESVKAKTAQEFSQILDRTNESDGTTGEKELTSEQQEQVSNFDFTVDFKKGNSSDEDGRSRFEDGKNSGLTPPFGSAQGSPDAAFSERIHKLTAEELARLSGAGFDEQTSDAVKDAIDMLQGGSLKDFLDSYLTEKQQDLSDMTGRPVGGSILDRLRSLLDPASNTGQPEGSATPKGTGMFAEGSLGVDPTPEEVEAAKKKYAAEHPDNPPDKAPPAEKDPNAIKPPDVIDVLENILFGWATKESPLPTPPVPPDPETGKNMLDGFRAIFGSKDRTPESETKKGGAGMPDPENYHGNIPAELQHFMDYLRKQAMDLKPHPGGENILTDGNAGNVPIGGPVDSVLAKQGKFGLIGQPDQTADQIHLGGGGSAGSTTTGGAIDYGPDSDKVGYTGPTRSEDPGDIQFGPSQPLEQPAKTDESDDTNDSSSAAFNFLQNLTSRKKADE